MLMFIPLRVQSNDYPLAEFTKLNQGRPVMQANSDWTFTDPTSGIKVAWAADNVFNPAAVVWKGKVYVLFRAEDGSGNGIGMHTSRVGLAVSSDGVHFNVRTTPVLYPSNDGAKVYEAGGGCEDPRVVRSPAGYFVMTYTMWNRKTARLGVATSKDLIHWHQRGPAFGGAAGEAWTKSGSIVTKFVKGEQVATKLNGKYWMYFGEGAISLATSPDLIHWTPFTPPRTKEPKLFNPVISPRKGFFDSDLTEAGPPAVLTAKGIVLLYNGKNAMQSGDTKLLPGIYSMGEMVLDPKAPWKTVSRPKNFALTPQKPWEFQGQYKPGTNFAEGLVWFHRHWLVYYGISDSGVGVASSPEGTMYNPYRGK